MDVFSGCLTVEGSDPREPVRPFLLFPAMAQCIAPRAQLILRRLGRANCKAARRKLLAQLVEVPPFLAHAL